jgi:hypothetical protein
VCSRVLRLSLIVICMFIVTLIEVTAWAAGHTCQSVLLRV